MSFSSENCSFRTLP